MNLIHKYPSAFSKESCEKAIDWFKQNIYQAFPGKAGVKNLNNLEITIHVQVPEDFFNLGAAIKKGIEDFKKKYEPFETSLGGWRLNTNAQICRFEPNNYYYKIHCENDGHPQRLNRVFGWMVYLNDIKQGGGTEFIFQNFKTIPKAGDFYIWPAGASHMHRGENAPFERKYLITGWFIFQ